MEISYNYEVEFILSNERKYSDWIGRILDSEGYALGELAYVFCNDSYLLNLNQRFLDHNTLTDIITFDYCNERVLSGDIFISVERVKDNAETYDVDFDDELLRVMAHGLLHLMGYGDKAEDEVKQMREKENEKTKLFHVEH